MASIQGLHFLNPINVALLESLSNYDGDADENVTRTTNFTVLQLLCYYPN